MSTQTVMVRLTQRVPGLGNAGDVCRVKFGYARNLLLTKGLAVIVSDGVATRAATQQKERVKGRASERNAVVEIAESLNGKSVTLTVPANAEGRLFASIQPDDVAAALETDPIFRMNPIKTIGDHNVTLDFGHDIVSLVTVTIRSNQSSSGKRSK